MSRRNVSSVSGLYYNPARHGNNTQAILVPNEPFVSISEIFLSDNVSHEITLPSYVVVFSVFPSGESDRAHASPIISRVSPEEVKIAKGPVPSTLVVSFRAGVIHEENEATCRFKPCFLFPFLQVPYREFLAKSRARGGSSPILNVDHNMMRSQRMGIGECVYQRMGR
jgi:hypothetical protein